MDRHWRAVGALLFGKGKRDLYVRRQVLPHPQAWTGWTGARHARQLWKGARPARLRPQHRDRPVGRQPVHGRNQKLARAEMGEKELSGLELRSRVDRNV